MALFVPLRDQALEDHPLFKGVRIAKLVTKERSTAVGVSLLEIAPGVEIPVHTHESSIDSIYVVEGEGEAMVDGAWQEIRAGDYVFVDAGEEHGVRSSEDTGLRLFVVHSPPLF